jgi:hypothetical protein
MGLFDSDYDLGPPAAMTPRDYAVPTDYGTPHRLFGLLPPKFQYAGAAFTSGRLCPEVRDAIRDQEQTSLAFSSGRLCPEVRDAIRDQEQNIPRFLQREALSGGEG